MDRDAAEPDTPTLDTGFHDRRLARRLEDPAYRKEYERELRQVQAVDQLVRELEALRAEHGISKAELARAIDKNPAAVRRLLTASGNPELKTVVAMAEALDADVRIVPRARPARRRAVAKTDSAA
jgi:DNA-binding XRE family transcriptional regulator